MKKFVQISLVATLLLILAFGAFLAVTGGPESTASGRSCYYDVGWNSRASCIASVINLDTRAKPTVGWNS
jgi:hypothetical protein